MVFEELRNKYSTFIYDDFKVTESKEEFTVIYKYIMGNYVFTPKVIILKKHIKNNNINKTFLNYLFFNYGLVDLINYYKLVCSKRIIVRAGILNDNQKHFFKKLIYNGLGEYLYKNNIKVSFGDLVSFENESDINYDYEVNESFNGNLILVGGGKDSIVTTELLKQYKNENDFFMLERNIYPKNKAGYESIYTAGYTDDHIITFKVELDPLMLELNKKGFLNGHVPFSSQLAFAAIIMAYLNNKKHVVLSNEASANETNIIGSTVNHQYSKSIEFERDFRNYVMENITDKIEYFSLLRPWSEYQIVKYFVKRKKYLTIFRSCNRGTKKNVWCSDCSKCLYVYIMLSPFLNEKELNNIFGQNMLEREDMQSVFDALINDDVTKPFECVGSRDEINYALYLDIKKGQKLPYLLNYYKENYYDEKRKYHLDDYFNLENFVPSKFIGLLENENEK
ncbi:MAG: hypothetical protein RSA10_03080 [Bacilli bacterium]